MTTFVQMEEAELMKCIFSPITSSGCSAVDKGLVLEIMQPCNNHETHLAATNMPVSLFGTAYPTHVNYILNLQIYI